MKAILMIDMPHDCVYCPCWRGGNDEFPFDDCTAVQRPLTVEERDNKPDWCPLKPLPTEFKTYKLSPRDQDETELFINMAMIKVYADGYNACLKEIEE